MRTRFRSGAGGIIASFLGMMFALHNAALQAGGCGCPICEPAYQLVERTVYVPTTVMEQRTVNVTEFRLETRQRTVMFNRCVPETRQVSETFVIRVPEARSRMVTSYVPKPVWREVEQRVMVQVPYQEQRQGVHRVCRQIQTEELRTISRDHGHWEDVVCDGKCTGAHGCGSGCGHGCRPRRFGCGRCGGCGGWGPSGGYVHDAGRGSAVVQHTHQVWRPNVVTEQVPVKVWRNQVVEEPYQHTVTLYRPEERTQRIKVCEYVTEERTREVRYTVYVPKQQTRVRNVTSYKMVSEPRVDSYTVRIPYTVAKEVDVAVCRMMPKTIVCRLPNCGAGGHAPGFRGCLRCGW